MAGDTSEVTGARRIALLIDAENVSLACVDRAIKEMSRLGEIPVRRAFGNWAAPDLQGWKDKLLELAIRPVQQFGYVKGKNAADIALVMDAMELLLTGRLNTFCIVSSDSDFTPLVMRLRENGCQVFGVGKPDAIEPYAAAFTAFFKVKGVKPMSGAAVAGEKPPAPTKSQAAPVEKPKGTKAAKLVLPDDTVSKLLEALEKNVTATGWAEMAATCNHARTAHGIDPADYKRKHVRALFSASDRFKVVTPGNGKSYVADVQNKKRAEKPV